jgi:Alpha-(1,6)-fucosyltransferase N- and catalytic domains
MIKRNKWHSPPYRYQLMVVLVLLALTIMRILWYDVHFVMRGEKSVHGLRSYINSGLIDHTPPSFANARDYSRAQRSNRRVEQAGDNKGAVVGDVNAVKKYTQVDLSKDAAERSHDSVSEAVVSDTDNDASDATTNNVVTKDGGTSGLNTKGTLQNQAVVEDVTEKDIESITDTSVSTYTISDESSVESTLHVEDAGSVAVIVDNREPDSNKAAFTITNTTEYTTSHQNNNAQTTTTDPGADAPPTRICHPWTHNSDEWWTHHPDWFVSLENDTHYCFDQITPYGSPKAVFLREFYQNQYQYTVDSETNETVKNCSHVMTIRMWSSGWGADMSNVISGMNNAFKAGRPLQTIVLRKGWHYASLKDASKPVCPLKNQYCFFLNMTHCEPRKNHIENPRYEYDYKARPYSWIMEYITRQQTWLRKEVYDYYKTSFHINMPCTAIHVRRGDIILHNSTTRKYHAVEEYMNTTIDVDRNVLLLTDDQNAIAEAESKFPQYNWMYEKRQRHNATEGGWENHFPSGDPRLEMVILLATFRAVQQCNKMVRTISTIGEYFEGLQKERYGKNATCVNIEIGKPFKQVSLEENLAVSIGQWQEK